MAAGLLEYLPSRLKELQRLASKQVGDEFFVLKAVSKITAKAEIKKENL